MRTKHKTINWKRSCIQKERKDERPQVQRSHPALMNAVIFRVAGSRGCGRGCLVGCWLLGMVTGNVS